MVLVSLDEDCFETTRASSWTTDAPSYWKSPFIRNQTLSFEVWLSYICSDRMTNVSLDSKNGLTPMEIYTRCVTSLATRFYELPLTKRLR